MPSEKRTYFSYREGIDPKLLQLGSLVHDYANPRTKMPFVHPEWSEGNVEKWTTSDQRPFATLAVKSGTGFDIGGGLESLADLNVERAGGDCTVVVGKNASKWELKDADSYLKEVILKSDDARIWFSSRLAVANKLYYLRKMTLQRPEIWLLTGVYLIEDATTWTITDKSSNTSIAGSIPLPDPTALTSLLDLNPSLHYAVGKSFLRKEGTQILGKKVWAAQYQRIKAKYFTVADGTESPVDNIKLLSILSTQKSRGEGEFIDFSVSDDFALEQSGDEVQENQEFTEDYWKEFELDVTELVEELAED